MAETPYNHYALYEPDASPDLTATGEYNRAIMGIDSDMHAEQIEREHAETEISANSADLTGIKSLTYGSEHVQFIENDNGSYSSPALDEIQHEISDSTLKTFVCTATSTSADENLTFNKVKDVFANSVVIANEMYLFPFWTDGKSKAIYTGSRENTSGHRAAIVTVNSTTVAEHLTTWGEIINKPFSTIGSGLKVESNALTLDASALPSGITVMQLSEFGVLTYDEYARPRSASGEGNAAAYTKLQQAWPNVVVVSGQTSWDGGMYTPANWSQAGYLLTKSTVTNNTHVTPVEMKVAGSGYSGAVTLKEFVATGITPDTQWGTIEA